MRGFDEFYGSYGANIDGFRPVFIYIFMWLNNDVIMMSSREKDIKLIKALNAMELSIITNGILKMEPLLKIILAKKH